ncbi:MAG TPA: AraC family transcriptional regulator [Kofleriaceae bacterium]|nr:AraC family transcriptional regulator [Kofleriaceae bacterium]
MARPLPPDDAFRRLVRVRDWLHAHAAEPVGLDELARRAGMSRFHFVRRWRDAFGVTPHQDLTRMRLDRAKALLAADAARVTDVCLEVGFTSLGSFSALFAERIGCPPGAWRRRYWQVARAATRGPAELLIPWCFVQRHAS